MLGVIVLMMFNPAKSLAAYTRELVARRRTERLRAQSHHRGHRYQRHLELGVEPLHLDDAAAIRVQVESTIRPEIRLHRNDRGRPGIDDGRVIGARLPVDHVDLDTDDTLGLADLTNEVEPAAGPAIPIGVVGGQIPVVVAGVPENVVSWSISPLSLKVGVGA